ncbi:hypothetical protein RND71_018167 [Anisodus tanguticus]|uniref:Major facilitator superfamily (MFS) profile domain-containing protein n=1 Tax=Anisodus tanguticus TaxID=243964 RepID=A0AAE1S3Q9_9SOLA|nr:hypothetical protein RND71_018167 [Anisodus tanguticus]
MFKLKSLWELSIYSLVGAAVAGRTSDWIGRRYTIVFASIIFFVGAILMGFATNFWLLMLGRFVAGIGVGYALMIAPVYTAEVAPASCGFCTSFPGVLINGGVLLCYVSNCIFHAPIEIGMEIHAWNWSDSISVVRHRCPRHARITTLASNAGSSWRCQENCQDDIDSVTRRSSHGEGVWRELFLSPTPTVLHILIAGIGVHLFQQASGIDAVVMYSLRIYEKAGIDIVITV